MNSPLETGVYYMPPWAGSSRSAKPQIQSKTQETSGSEPLALKKLSAAVKSQSAAAWRAKSAISLPQLFLSSFLPFPSSLAKYLFAHFCQSIGKRLKIYCISFSSWMLVSEHLKFYVLSFLSSSEINMDFVYLIWDWFIFWRGRCRIESTSLC